MKSTKKSLEEKAIQQTKSFHRRPNKVIEWFKRHKKNAVVLAISTALVIGSIAYLTTGRIKEATSVASGILDNEKHASVIGDAVKNNSAKLVTSDLPMQDQWSSKLSAFLFTLKYRGRHQKKGNEGSVIDTLYRDIEKSIQNGTIHSKIGKFDSMFENYIRQIPRQANILLKYQNDMHRAADR